MLFNSVQFFLFLAAVLVAIAALRRERSRRVLLLAASDLFYAWWDWRFLILFWFLKVANYYIGNRLAAQTPSPSARRTLAGGVILNLITLGFFKYYYFFGETMTGLGSALGWNLGLPDLSIVLPLGISFYTFQALAYLVDIYRRELPPARSLFEFSLFLGFFPQVIAGPIERGHDLLPQLRQSRPLSAGRFSEGSFLILWGLFKKVVVADTLAMRVDPLFAASDVDAGMAILAGIGFSFQIYADFSAYTDIARGAARLLGYDLSQNFRQPLFACSPREFWQSWHMTFSRWLRDYIYFPLGGSRKGLFWTNFNILVTFFLCGLWHGAAWTFVLWGVYQGVLLAVNANFVVLHRRLTARFKLPKPGPVVRVVGIVLAWALTFSLLAYGRILFRSESLAQVGEFTAALGRGSFASTFALDLLKTTAYVMPVVVYDAIVRLTKDEFAVVNRSPWLGGLFIAALLYGLMVFGVIGGDTFIYFEF